MTVKQLKEKLKKFEDDSYYGDNEVLIELPVEGDSKHTVLKGVDKLRKAKNGAYVVIVTH